MSTLDEKLAARFNRVRTGSQQQTAVTPSRPESADAALVERFNRAKQSAPTEGGGFRLPGFLSPGGGGTRFTMKSPPRPEGTADFTDDPRIQNLLQAVELPLAALDAPLQIARDARDRGVEFLFQTLPSGDAGAIIEGLKRASPLHPDNLKESAERVASVPKKGVLFGDLRKDNETEKDERFTGFSRTFDKAGIPDGTARDVASFVLDLVEPGVPITAGAKKAAKVLKKADDVSDFAEVKTAKPIESDVKAPEQQQPTAPKTPDSPPKSERIMPGPKGAQKQENPAGLATGAQNASKDVAVNKKSEVSRAGSAQSDQITKDNIPEANPSLAQKESGNYKKGHVSHRGLDIAVESVRGDFRTGVSRSGKAWKTKMHHDYGYFKRTEGKDGDQVDVFIGERPDDDLPVFIVNQIDPETGRFDEHKVLMGFKNSESAKQGYLSNYDKGWKGFGSMAEMPIDDFKAWLNKGKRNKPAESVISSIDAQVVPKDFSQTSPKNAAVAQDRTALGLDGLETPERKTWQKSIDNALEKGIEKKARRIADEMAEKPRQLSDEETAGLAIRMSELKKEYSSLVRNESKTTDPAELRLNGNEAERIAQEFDHISRANQAGGTEIGRALAARKLTLNEDYDLLTNTSRARLAKGRDLSVKEKSVLTKLTKELERKTKEFDDLQKKFDDAVVGSAMRNNKYKKMSRAERRKSFTADAERAKKLLSEGCTIRA